MRQYVRVKLEELPSTAQPEVGELIVAFALIDRSRYLVRHVNAISKRWEELEFDPARDRYLSLAERRREQPAAHTYELCGHRVVESYRITERGHATHVHLDIFAPGVATKLTEVDELFHAGFPMDKEKVVARAIAQASLPKRYADWDEETKVGHWAQWLHRIRREYGDSGSDEDNAFKPALLAHMEREDPDVRTRLRSILSLAARMGQEEPQVMIDSFAKRVGIEIP